jgi:hypothetical protein
MVSLNAATFCRSFGRYQREVQREPIEVVNHGSVTGYFVSPNEYQAFTQWKARQPQAYHPSELPAHLKEALQSATMESGHEHLNELLKD